MNVQTSPLVDVAPSLAVADIFDRAAERIERDGWHREGFYPGWDDTAVDAPHDLEAGRIIRERNLPCDVPGALFAEVHTIDAAKVVFDTLADHLDPTGWGGDPAVWNDYGLAYGMECYDQRRDPDRVVRELRRAAQSVREAIGAVELVSA